MTKISKTIIFFGTEDFSLYALKALVEGGFSVRAVVTKPDTKRGRGGVLTQPAVKVFAKAHGIPVWQPNKLSEIIKDIKQFDTPVGVLVAFGKIIPQSVIDCFTPGIINIHPSLLPLYRGPSPVEAAIANRDIKTGVTIMQLTKAMDAGPIYLQVPYVLDQSETKPELYQVLFSLGANLLIKTLPRIIDGTLTPEPQDESKATYCSLLDKSDSIIDPSTTTPGQAEARIRAHLGFPRTRLRVGKYEVIATKAHAVMTKKTPLDIECQNGAFLSIDELIAPSGRTMNADDFLRGYKV